MKYCLLMMIAVLFQVAGQAQQEPVELPVDDVQRPAAGRGLHGRVVDEAGKGIQAAAVQVYAYSQQPGGSQVDTLVTGMLTKANGDFNFPSLGIPDSFLVRVTAVGYGETTRPVTMYAPTAGQHDLGNIRLLVEAKTLGTVTVVASRPTIRIGIDRKVFNVDQNITSAGGTAIDVMRNIPSVTVDAEGNVQLRNVSPQVFVDGRPTILTLQQIPADDIDRVELITNPSAKFDAATTGGIINVVLKKNKRAGLNGVATAGIGTPKVLNGNLSLNVRQGKFNVFGSANYNQSGGIARSRTKRYNLQEGRITDYFNQVSETDRLRRFTAYRFGADYFMDNRNTLTLSQQFVNGTFESDQVQGQEYLDEARQLLQLGSRSSRSHSDFYRSNTQLNYKHSFPKSGQELTADITYNEGKGSSNTAIKNSLFTPAGALLGIPNLVDNLGTNLNRQLTVQIDYAHPITETSKYEVGLRGFTNRTENVLDAFSINNGNAQKLSLSSNVAYDETILAAYGTYTNVWKGIRYQAGLRAEQSSFDGVLVDSNRTFGYRLPANIGRLFDGLFPSLYLSKDVGHDQEIQLNFSRRIRRPQFWQLNPYIDINDPLNISQGNPTLRPEYVNAFEFNYNKRYNKGNFLGVIYYRNNQDDITRYSDTISAAQYSQLNNAAIEPNAILNTFINARYTNRVGAEFTLQHKLGNFEFIPNINLQYRKVNASVGKLDLNNEGFNWESKMIVNYNLSTASKVLNNTHFQLTGQYESARVIPQGREREQYEVDLAIRKEFLKNKAGAITLSVNDLFNTRRYGQIYDTETYYQDAYNRWSVRTIRLTFTYRFGKKDFRLLNSSPRSIDHTNDDDR